MDLLPEVLDEALRKLPTGSASAELFDKLRGTVLDAAENTESNFPGPARERVVAGFFRGVCNLLLVEAQGAARARQDAATENERLEADRAQLERQAGDKTLVL
jgi:hypothetical protein